MGRFTVRLKGNPTPAVIIADYFRVIDGALWFRNTAQRLPSGELGYPQPVVVFAAGEWQEVMS